MKVTLTARVKSVGPIEPTKKNNGYVQRVVIEQPEQTDEYNRTTSKQQIFQLEIFDKDKTAKFLDQSAIGSIREFKMWLKGEQSEKDGKQFFFLKLKLL